jgi:hypothetical protein
MPHGFSRLENHATMNQLYEPLLKQAGYFAEKQVICLQETAMAWTRRPGTGTVQPPSLPVPGPAHAVTPGK